jgi:hypothetical protein
VANAKNFIDFFIEKIIFQKKSIREKISEMEEKILPFIVEVPDPILKGKFISKIAKGFDVKEEFIIEALKKVEQVVKEEQKNELKRNFLPEENFDISSKSGIISDTRKKILRELTAIYFWQKSLPDAEQWENPQTILEKIKEFSDKETFEKILNLKQNFIDLLILEVQVKFEESTRENFLFSLSSLFDRFEKMILKDKILELKKKLSLADSDQKKDILIELQELIKREHNL